MNKKILIALLSGVVATTMVACNGDTATAGASGGQSGGDTGKTVAADTVFDFNNLPQHKMNASDSRIASGLIITLANDTASYTNLDSAITLLNSSTGEEVAITTTIKEDSVIIKPQDADKFAQGNYTLETKGVKLTNGDTVENSTHNIEIASDNTVLCSAENVGSIINVGGLSYKVVDDSTLAANVNTHICTSHLTSLANLTDLIKGEGSTEKYFTTEEKAEFATFDTSNVTSLDGTFKNARDISDLNLSSWDVSNVKDLAWAFQNSDFDNDSLKDWVVSNVTDFAGMFDGASAFNQDISNWNVGSATDMSLMFNEATSYNHSLSAWHDKLGNVATMDRMFKDATSFNQDLSTWLVGNVNNYANFATNTALVTADGSAMKSGGAENFPHFKAIMTDDKKILTCNFMPIGGNVFNDVNSYTVVSDSTLAANVNEDICTSHVTSLANAFNGKDLTATQKAKIAAYDTHNVTNLQGVFNGATNIWDLNLGNWDVSKVKNLSWAFQDSGFRSDSIKNWKVSSVTNFDGIFSGAYDFNQDISGWKTGSAKTMASMFKGAKAFNQAVWDWDVSKVENMANMFNGASEYNKGMNAWNTSSVKNMSGMFENATKFNGDLWKWNTSKVTTMADMFKGASKFNQALNSTVDADGDHWNTLNVTDMHGMFQNAKLFDRGIWDWNTSNVTQMYDMFNGASAYTKGLSGWKDNLSQVKSMDRMFQDATAFLGGAGGDVPGWNVNRQTGHSSFAHDSKWAWPTNFR